MKTEQDRGRYIRELFFGNNPYAQTDMLREAVMALAILTDSIDSSKEQKAQARTTIKTVCETIAQIDTFIRTVPEQIEGIPSELSMTATETLRTRKLTNTQAIDRLELNMLDEKKRKQDLLSEIEKNKEPKKVRELEELIDNEAIEDLVDIDAMGELEDTKEKGEKNGPRF